MPAEKKPDENGILHHPECSCNQCCACDNTMPRLFEQASGRYNDQSGNAMIAQMQNFILQQQANWAAISQRIHDNGFASTSQQLEFIKNTNRS